MHIQCLYSYHPSPRRCDVDCDRRLWARYRAASMGREMGGGSFLQPADLRGRAAVLCHRTRSIGHVQTVRHFGYYLYGKMFMVYTDHQPLCQLLTSNRLNGTEENGNEVTALAADRRIPVWSGQLVCQCLVPKRETQEE